MMEKELLTADKARKIAGFDKSGFTIENILGQIEYAAKQGRTELNLTERISPEMDNELHQLGYRTNSLYQKYTTIYWS